MSDPTIEIVRITGLDDIIRITNPERARRIIARSLKRIGLIVERNSKPVTPVKKGNLKRSITSVPLEWNRVAVGTKVDYALYVHEGTRNPDGTRRMLGRPYLRQGLERSRDQINREIDRALDEAISA
jgi:hypothetical protein